MKIKSLPDYLFNENMILNIKDCDSSLLEVNRLSFKGVFNLNIYYIKYIPTKDLKHINVDYDKDFLYLFLNDVDGYIEENDRIKYLVFTPTKKNKEALTSYKKRRNWKKN